MNDNVIHMTPAQQPELDRILATAVAFLRAWQEGRLKPMPLLHEALERHAKLMKETSENLQADAQKLEAKLNINPLDDIIEALAGFEDEELWSMAHGEIQDVLTRLALQVSRLRAARTDLLALPALDPTSDETRLSKRQTQLESGQVELDAEIKVEEGKLEAVRAALQALEAIEVEVKFEGLVPTPEQLAALALPGGEAALLAEAATKALKDLEKIVGLLVSGQHYSRLQDERRRLAGNLDSLKERQLAQSKELAECLRQLTALEGVPPLLAQRSDWSTAVNGLTLSLDTFLSELKGTTPQDVAGLQNIADLFNSLLAYQRSILGQIRDGF
ncbi:alpha-xenorhabdolysin family binary toxin subunit B [Pseudomonas entomophila]|nr:alpha-xenorhabdolysin family binary toxin subunit B [Pseudomonas entomophila]WMW07219.1 alpha-xenorhabdolysin family binary toxin subunit B [Pseudomonas entomophila]